MNDIETLLRWHSAGIELNTSQYATLADGMLGLKDELEEAQKEDRREALRIELMEEQLGFARQLMHKIDAALRYTTAKAIKEAISTAIDEAGFEY